MIHATHTAQTTRQPGKTTIPVAKLGPQDVKLAHAVMLTSMENEECWLPTGLCGDECLNELRQGMRREAALFHRPELRSAFQDPAAIVLLDHIGGLLFGSLARHLDALDGPRHRFGELLDDLAGATALGPVPFNSGAFMEVCHGWDSDVGAVASELSVVRKVPKEAKFHLKRTPLRHPRALTRGPTKHLQCPNSIRSARI